MFASDNDFHWLSSDIEIFRHEANSGRSGYKSDVWDGTHRVLFIASWTSKIYQFEKNNLYTPKPELAKQLHRLLNIARDNKTTRRL